MGEGVGRYKDMPKSLWRWDESKAKRYYSMLREGVGQTHENVFWSNCKVMWKEPITIGFSGSESAESEFTV